jgi:hypothetical protein
MRSVDGTSTLRGPNRIRGGFQVFKTIVNVNPGLVDNTATAIEFTIGQRTLFLPLVGTDAIAFVPQANQWVMDLALIDNMATALLPVVNDVLVEPDIVDNEATALAPAVNVMYVLTPVAGQDALAYPLGGRGREPRPDRRDGARAHPRGGRVHRLSRYGHRQHCPST